MRKIPLGSNQANERGRERKASIGSFSEYIFFASGIKYTMTSISKYMYLQNEAP